MDNFIDKLAQKFSAQDMIKANLAAEAKETRKLREKMESYESLLQEMRQINLKNMESAERVNRILQEGTFTDKEYLQELFAKKEESLQAEFAKTEEILTNGFVKMDESLHTENVKVYRNVQAVVVEEVGNKAENIIKAQEENSKKYSKPVLIFAVLAFIAATANLVLQIFNMLGIRLV